jgi:DNA-binding CsgD family transcriptional regulator
MFEDRDFQQAAKTVVEEKNIVWAFKHDEAAAISTLLKSIGGRHELPEFRILSALHFAADAHIRNVTKQLCLECENVVSDVIRNTNLPRVFHNDVEEAKQYLRSCVVEAREALFPAERPLRYVILRRAALSCIRAYQRECEHSMVMPMSQRGADTPWVEQLLEAGADQSSTTAEIRETQELLAHVNRELKRLTDKELQILQDQRHGVPSSKTAKRLNISAGMVRQIRRRVRMKLSRY